MVNPCSSQSYKGLLENTLEGICQGTAIGNRLAPLDYPCKGSRRHMEHYPLYVEILLMFRNPKDFHHRLDVFQTLCSYWDILPFPQLVSLRISEPSTVENDNVIQCGCFLKWWYPQNTPKMIILSRKTHGCWVPPF